ncbi:uncharacterized protein [Hyperolius riggenbachi]|uniref:uncharacterized protein n=1 Tax=Hyperolius riggenbachi TaxID=752182 RepID=UPI0035A33973
MSGTGRTPRKTSSVRMVAQDCEDSSPPSIVRVTIPKVPLTRKSKQREPLTLIRRKMLCKNQEIQEIKILGYGEESLSLQDNHLLAHLPTKNEPIQEDELCPRFQTNDAATQTEPIYCFNNIEEIVEFLNNCSRAEDSSPKSISFTDEPVDEPIGEDTISSDDHPRTLKLEIDEDEDGQPIISHLFSTSPFHYASTSSPPFPMVKRRRKQRFHCDWQGPISVISSPNVPAHAMEVRVDEDLAMSIRRQVDINNPGPFGWQLAKLLFTEEELYGHNFNGTDQKMPLSPRRVHAIQHAFHDYFPKDIADEALAKGRTAINQGIRNMFYVRNRRDGDYS